MKYAIDRPYADPEAAARKLIEIANSVEAVQEGRIHNEFEDPIPGPRTLSDASAYFCFSIPTQVVEPSVS
jgi:hypothetical protein